MTSINIVPIKEILDYSFPNLQRNLNQDHINAMIEDQKAEYAAKKAYSMVQSITVARFENNHYVLDGQHRIKAYKALEKQGYPVTDNIPIVIYTVQTREEILSYYNLINKNMPIHPLEIGTTWELYDKPILFYLEQTYGAYFKNENSHCVCPHIGLKGLKNQLKARDIGNKLYMAEIDVKTYIANIEKLNTMFKEKRNDIARYQLDTLTMKKIDQCEKKIPSSPCFLGIWRKYEWLDLVDLMIFHGKDIDTLIFSDFTVKSRNKISIVLREKVWQKINSSGETGHCFTCEEGLDFKSMECAHIIAHSLNGPDTLENLMPTCKKCNRDCGVMNLFEYKKLLLF